MNFFALMQNASGNLPNWAVVTPEEAQAEYERDLLEPYGGVNSYEEFIQRQSEITGANQDGQGGPGGGLISDIITNTKKRSFGENVGVFVGGALNPGKSIGEYYGSKMAPYIKNGGVVLIGVIFLIGAFLIIGRSTLK